MTNSYHIEGVSLNGGLGLGRPVFHQSSTIYYAPTSHHHSEAITFKEAHLDEAFANLIGELQQLIPSQSESFSEVMQTNLYQESRKILETHLLLAHDPGWKKELKAYIQKGSSAFQAVDLTLESIREKLTKMGPQSHWFDRIADFEDLSGRLKRHLTPSKTFEKPTYEGPIILFADRMGPAELFEYDRTQLVGLVLTDTSQTSHVAIIARSFNIPIVGGIKEEIKNITSEDLLFLNGHEGRLYVRPTADMITSYEGQFINQNSSHFVSEPTAPISRYEAMAAFKGCETLDGVPIALFLNAGLIEDLNHIDPTKAEGVGLYRTEIPFMMRSKLPNVPEQVKLYQEILNRAGEKPVVFRTLDVGGDKVLPYLEKLRSKNTLKRSPSTNTVFDRAILLRYQLRALVKACAGRDLFIKLPMVAEVSEVQATRALLEKEVQREQAKGNKIPKTVQLGIMIEVPAIVWQLPHLLPWVDFVSIGSNDLFQFFYAIKREHSQLSERYDPLSSSFLSLLDSIQKQCKEADVPVGICGEIAGKPLEMLALIGLGYRAFSMSPNSIPMIRSVISNLSCEEITAYMTSIRESSPNNIREKLIQFSQDRGFHMATSENSSLVSGGMFGKNTL